jgi:hypothetical protein
LEKFKFRMSRAVWIISELGPAVIWFFRAIVRPHSQRVGIDICDVTLVADVPSIHPSVGRLTCRVKSPPRHGLQNGPLPKEIDVAGRTLPEIGQRSKKVPRPRQADNSQPELAPRDRRRKARRKRQKEHPSPDQEERQEEHTHSERQIRAEQAPRAENRSREESPEKDHRQSQVLQTIPLRSEKPTPRDHVFQLLRTEQGDRQAKLRTPQLVRDPDGRSGGKSDLLRQTLATRSHQRRPDNGTGKLLRRGGSAARHRPNRHRHHHGSVGISLRETGRFRQSPERDGGQPVGRSADEHVLVHLLQKLEPSGHPRELHLGKKEELRSGPDHLEQLRGTAGLRVLRHQRQLLPHRTHDHQDLLQRGHPPLHPDHEPRRTGGATEPRRLQGHQKVAQEGRVPRRTAETDAATRYKHVETFSATFLHHAQRAHSLHQSVHFQQIGVLQRRREPEEQDHRVCRRERVFAPAAVFSDGQEHDHLQGNRTVLDSTHSEHRDGLQEFPRRSEVGHVQTGTSPGDPVEDRFHQQHHPQRSLHHQTVRGFGRDLSESLHVVCDFFD